MSNDYECKQLETIYNLKTETALLKQYITVLDKEINIIRKRQNAITILIITTLIGIISIFIQLLLK